MTDFDNMTEELIYEGINNNYLCCLSPGRLKQELAGILDECNAADGLRLISKYNILGRLTGCNVRINYGFNIDEFRRLNTNGRLAIVFCNNDLDTLNALKEKLDLGNKIIQNINRIQADKRGQR
jgi:tRNA nucleotidyltransferase/poly(A) polymerase